MSGPVRCRACGERIAERNVGPDLHGRAVMRWVRIDSEGTICGIGCTRKVGYCAPERAS